MKKAVFSFFLLLFLFGCGHDRGLSSNFRDVAVLQPIQTLGYDRSGGTVTLSASSGQGTEELPTALLRGSGRSIAEAMTSLQDYSAREELFFAHIRYVVVGEEAARQGLTELLDWFERTPQTRLDVPVFILEDGEAAELFEPGGEDGSEITQALQSLRRDTETQGLSVCFTLTDTARSLSEEGCALCCSIRRETAESHVPSSREDTAALETGFALLEGDALTGFTGMALSRGICLLLNRPGTGLRELTFPGGRASVSLSGGQTELRPVFDAAGHPSLEIVLRQRAGLVELDAEGSGETLRAELSDALGRTLKEEAETVLAHVRSSGADYLGLGRLFSRADPRAFSALDWAEELARLPVSVRSEAELERSYDLAAAETARGERTMP